MGRGEKTEANVEEGMVCVLGRERNGIKSLLVAARSQLSILHPSEVITKIGGRGEHEFSARSKNNRSPLDGVRRGCLGVWTAKILLTTRKRAKHMPFISAFLKSKKGSET